jgi:hypothetical protein
MEVRKHKFIIEIELPEFVNIIGMKNYIHSSVSSMCGSLHPYDDPLFDLNRDSIKVTHLTKKRAIQLLKDFENAEE